MCAYIYCSQGACLSSASVTTHSCRRAGVRVPYGRYVRYLHPSPAAPPGVSPRPISSPPPRPAAPDPLVGSGAVKLRSDPFVLCPLPARMSMMPISTTHSSSPRFLRPLALTTRARCMACWCSPFDLFLCGC